MRTMIGAAVAVLALLGLASAAAAQSDVAEFRRLRSEGVAAANADDLATADNRLAQADALIPNHPGMMLMRARLAAQGPNPADGLAHLRRYADAGLVVDPSRDPALSQLAGTPGYDEAVARIAVNRQPVGADRLSVVASLPAGLLVESVVRDEAHGRWLVSTIAERTILAVADDGSVTPWLAEIPQTGGLLGLTADPARGWLWAASAPLPPALHAAQGELPRAALLRIELETGRINAWFEAPTGDGHAFGDVALGPDGTAYVADASGAIFRVRPVMEATLETVAAAGAVAAPQGMVVTPDGKALIVADYSSGLLRIDLATGVLVRLAAPADASLIGVDGLASDGRGIYALQNGVAPQRVLKLTLDVNWSRIDVVEVMAANLPEIDEPTTGLVHEGGLVFVSRSQWSDFDDDGALKPGADGPAIIARLRLD